MKKLVVFLLVMVLGELYAQRLVILHTNDIHSRLTGYGPELAYTPLKPGDDKTVGGFARLASVINTEKRNHPDNLLILDAGDFLMGTLFHALEPETGFQLNLMKQLGYDAITFGNHEYDFGTDALAEMVLAANKKGGTPPIIASYLKFSDEPGDDKLQKLYDEKKILPYVVVEKNGLKIGIFSVLGYDAQHDVKFAKPLEFYDPVKTAKKYTKILRKKEHADIIICLSHSGIYPDDNGGYTGEDIEMAKKVKDIDIIISGHTHVETPDYIKVGKTIIVQTGSYLHNVGHLEIEYKNNRVNVVDFKLIPLDDEILGDKDVEEKIENFERRINSELLKPYGLKYSQKVVYSGFTMKLTSHRNPEPSPLGNLVSDAIKYYVDNYSEGTDIVLTANGVIRENLFTGFQTPADAFRIMSLGFGDNDYLGYPLVKLYITGRELKKLMEITLLSNKPGSDKYLYYSGVKVYYDPDGGFLNKVREIYVNGKKIDISKKNKKLYSLTTDIYIASFIGYIKKLSHGLVKVVPKDANGNAISDFHSALLDFDKNKPGIQEGKQWLALIYYFATFKDTNGDGVPEIPEKYKTYSPTLIKQKSETSR